MQNASLRPVTRALLSATGAILLARWGAAWRDRVCPIPVVLEWAASSYHVAPSVVAQERG